MVSARPRVARTSEFNRVFNDRIDDRTVARNVNTNVGTNIRQCSLPTTTTAVKRGERDVCLGGTFLFVSFARGRSPPGV